MDLDRLKTDIKAGNLDRVNFESMLVIDLNTHLVKVKNEDDGGFLARIFRYIFGTCDTCSTGGCAAGCTNGCSNASCSNVACFSAQCSGGPCSQACTSCSNGAALT
ncbi:MAG: hypothetical protein IJU92_10050 [Spirochaetaceae bacterium]|nr:hypothetical protein [Spirochaetaceae bacterium]